ncbi:MAG: DUF3791 domain-containing protein [Bacteroidales bacterium]|nr:DUF3791 domain-containing protein [Bacteroidales bacterium]MDD4670890.1 DUF3791 domain-containing protein [Bacteroidales bacterium]
MEKADRNKIEYVIALINEFAKRFSLSDVQAYRYIKAHRGVGFIQTQYDVMHTLDFKDAISGLAGYCHRFGGTLI